MQQRALLVLAGLGWDRAGWVPDRDPCTAHGEALKDGVVPLAQGPSQGRSDARTAYWLTLGQHKAEGRSIHRMCCAIESLPRPSRVCWEVGQKTKKTTGTV